MVAENVEGRERYPVNVRYNRDFRTTWKSAPGVNWHALWRADSNSEVAKVSFSRGPSMIRDETAR